MKALCRLLVAALAFFSAGGVGLAQTSPPGGPAAFGPRGGLQHGPFSVCPDPRSSGGCVVETSVRVRAGNRVEVRARGKVNFGGGTSGVTAGAAAGAILGVPVPPLPGGLGDAVRDPDGEAASDAASPAPALRKNSLLVLVAGAGSGFQPKGAKAGKFYQGGKSTSFTPAEDGELVLMPNDARPEDNRAVCEAGICGWEVTLEVYDAPAAGPVPVAAQPAGPDAMATRTPVSGSQPPQVGTLVANPGAGPQPAPGPALDTALGKGGAVVTAPGSVPPSQPPLAPAGGGSHPDDVAGSKDHPLVPRARGAVVRTYDLKKLDAYQLPLGPAVGSGFARSQMARGRLTFLVYELAPDCSVLEAGEHYAAALRQSGFETLFACEDASCGPSYGPDDGLRHPYWSSSYGERQVTAVLRRGGGTVYASVHVQGDSPSSARAWVTVVESAPGTPASAGAVSGPSTSPPGARQSVGSAAPGSKPAESAPVSGIGAAAPPVSGGAPQGGQSPVSGIGAGTQQLPGGSQGGQSPVSGIGAAGRASGGGSKAPQSQVPQPELTPEQRKALDDCIAMKLIGAGSQAGPQAAQNARSACEQQLGLPSTVAR